MQIRATHLVYVLSLLVAGLWSSPTWSHPGHGAPISKEEAVQRANAQISRLVEEGKIEKSWKIGGTLSQAEKRDVKGAQEWALVFTNAKAAEADKRTLYVFLSETGEYLAANFTGR